MPSRASKARDHARGCIRDAADGSLTVEARQLSAQIAVAQALLELAFQVGRVADNVPLFGPQEER
jgi:hypothetical protein